MRNSPLPTVASLPRIVFPLLVLTVGLYVFSACAPLRKITRDISGPGGDLQKKVAVTAFENRTRTASDELIEGFHRRLSDRLAQACSEILPATPGVKTFPDNLKNLPKLSSGLIDNFTIAATGRNYGFNAIVTGNLLDIKIGQEAYSFWWFKGSRPYVELLVGMEILDTETAAKILDERFIRRIKIREEEYEALRAKETPMLPIVIHPLQRIADDVGESICSAINSQTWKGYIVTVLTDKVILSSGKDTGLIPGDVLEVYDSGSPISGHAGQQFFMPGLKIGKIRISGVYPNRSEAVVVSGANIKEGCSVKPK